MTDSSINIISGNPHIVSVDGVVMVWSEERQDYIVVTPSRVPKALMPLYGGEEVQFSGIGNEPLKFNQLINPNYLTNSLDKEKVTKLMEDLKKSIQRNDKAQRVGKILDDLGI